MATGQQMLDLAVTRLNQKYDFVLVPKNNANWQGPWDCAEFMSWLVWQVGGYLYGCTNNKGNPATAEAYTGAWQDAAAALGRRIPWQDAAGIAGAVLLRNPPAKGLMGHIVVSDGQGGTVEAMGKKWGVVRGKVSGRAWDTGILLPGFNYGAVVAVGNLKEPKFLYAVGRPGMVKAKAMIIQRALRDAGFDPGPIDGDYGDNTAVAVAAYQTAKGLVSDGQVGKQTAKSLKIDLS
jgi:murein L,D-transpeptidase YcbB/YkuD